MTASVALLRTDGLQLPGFEQEGAPAETHRQLLKGP
jgi:hypothetical protein